MPTIDSLMFTYHATHDRANRIEIIEKYVGWGEIIHDCYHDDAHHYITDTGVVLVVGRDHKVLTVYLLDMFRMVKYFSCNIPQSLARKVAYHQAQGWASPK